MFTGIVEALGRVHSLRNASGPTATLTIESSLARRLKPGGSLAVNGVCLTLTQKRGKRLFFNLVRETKKRSTLGNVRPGDPVNLERPLRAGARFEGHFVLGHVDGVGVVRKVLGHSKARSLLIGFPKNLRPYLVEKGSVAMDGVSLTLGKVSRGSFWLHLIPYTLRHTNFKTLGVHSRVNLEADALAKLP